MNETQPIQTAGLTDKQAKIKTIQDVFARVLDKGHPGRMIAGSKGRYRYNNPRNLTVFNSNVVVVGIGKVWHGDLDLTVDLPQLKAVAREISSILYVLNEMDGRFENEAAPKTDQAVISIGPDGTTCLKDSGFYYLDESGRAWCLTDEEYLAKHPREKRTITPVRYDRRKFKPVSVDPSSFKGKAHESPLAQFNSAIVKQVGLKKAKSVSWYFSSEQETAIKKSMEKWMRRHKLGDDYEIKKTLAWMTLDLPLNFIGTPKWADPAKVYYTARKR